MDVQDYFTVISHMDVLAKVNFFKKNVYIYMEKYFRS